MNDQALREGVIRLFMRDDGPDCLAAELQPPDRPPADEAVLRACCRQALWERLLDGVDLRVWISRLARDLFLTETALEAGLGLEDAAQFWLWFDRTMWAQPALGTPEHRQAEPEPPGRDRTRSSLWNSSGAAGPDV